jgi:DNA polymerase-4
MLAEFAGPRHDRRLLRVGVTLSDFSAVDAVQLNLFDAAAAPDAVTDAKRLALSRAIDKVNARFGRDAVTLGHDELGASRSGRPAIAFTRIPELEEFHE